MAAIGPWPAPCPVPPGARAALWWDGDLPAACAEAWLAAGGVAVVRLDPVAIGAAGPMDAPGGWGPAQAAAAANGCGWLVLPIVRRAAADPGAPLRWHAAAQALAAAGMGAYLPFSMLDPLAVARVALALGVDLDATTACAARCGACPACAERAAIWKALGRPIRPSTGA